MLLMLTSCSLLTKTPPDRAIELAITQQLMHTQKVFAQDLGMLDRQISTSAIEPNFKIDSITVQSRDKITNLSQFDQPSLSQAVDEVYRVSGKFDTTLTSNNIQKRQKSNPFEVLLGRKITKGSQVKNSIETWYFVQ
ncbi:MAG: hypothetical protein ACFB0D_00245 [Phormidesmis sp.]